MADADDGRARDRVEVAPALRVVQPCAVPAGDRERRVEQVAVQLTGSVDGRAGARSRIASLQKVGEP